MYIFVQQIVPITNIISILINYVINNFDNNCFNRHILAFSVNIIKVIRSYELYCKQNIIFNTNKMFCIIVYIIVPKSVSKIKIGLLV